MIDLFGHDTPQIIRGKRGPLPGLGNALTDPTRPMSRHRAGSNFKKWAQAHPEKDKAWRTAWRAANPAVITAHRAIRKDRVQQATPKWVDRRALRLFYQQRPVGHHVDHIIPLRGRTVEGYPVCGLHVPWNLQYLPELENVRKHNFIALVGNVVQKLARPLKSKYRRRGSFVSDKRQIGFLG